MKPVIYFNSRGQSGNIFYILGMVQIELRKQRRINDFNNLSERVHNSHSYKEALSIIRDYADLIDLDGIEV
jgi:hypothetical protein